MYQNVVKLTCYTTLSFILRKIIFFFSMFLKLRYKWKGLIYSRILLFASSFPTFIVWFASFALLELTCLAQI